MKKGKEILATTIVAGAMLMQGSSSNAQTSSPYRHIADEEIRPFKIHFDDAQLADLRKRILSTRWPEEETVTDHSQGVLLETIKALARYWATDYDWRELEIKLNSLPQFITTIDGLDIHFIHVCSKNKNALPLIVTHGWPGSIIEQLKIIDPPNSGIDNQKFLSLNNLLTCNPVRLPA